jgi:hypothetical protein
MSAKLQVVIVRDIMYRSAAFSKIMGMRNHEFAAESFRFGFVLPLA